MTVLRGIEFYGRLSRRDGRPANPGTYTLRFGLHADARTRRSNWTEDHDEVTVSPGGFFSVILGAETPLMPHHFQSAPRWLSVRVVRRGEAGDETGPRVPLTGAVLKVEADLQRMGRRVEALEGQLSELSARPSSASLRERLDAVEASFEQLSRRMEQDLRAPIASLEGRMSALDGDDGRLDRIGDRLEDLDGPDGDVVDLLDRLDTAERLAEASAREIVALSARLEQLQRRLGRAESVG